jgi:protein SCO1/2
MSGGEPRPRLVAALVAVATILLGLGALAASRSGDDAGTAVGADEEAGWHGALLAEPQPRPTFTLTDTSGASYDFAAETSGRLTLLFFGYTSCPDVCPIHMATLSAALEQPGMPDPIVVFVTTDPARDTPERLRSWLDNFGTDFVGLTGTPEQIAAAEDAAGVARSMIAAADGSPPAPGSDDYEVGHAAQIIAYTPDDLTHVQYPFGVRRQDWQADLPRLLETWGEPADDAGGRAGTATADGGAVTVSDAWAAADDTVTAVYLTIDNPGDADHLIGASTDVAGRVSAMGPGVAMPGGDDTPAGTALDLPVPSGTTDLAPGGTHVMLEQLTEPLVAGERITLRLEFEAAGSIDVLVEILSWDQVVERNDRRAEEDGA